MTRNNLKLEQDPQEDEQQAWEVGKPIAIDQMQTTTYLYSDNKSDGSFNEQLILQVSGFTLAGQAVNFPGFGSKFGMYFLIDATGHSTPAGLAFDTMHIALMVDRGANDGAPSSTQSGGVGFANGSSDDVSLATGALFSAEIAIDANGVRHPHFVETMTPTAAGRQVFGDSLDPGALLQELLTTPGGPTVIPVSGGETIQIVNGTGASGAPATGLVGLSPQAPLLLRPAVLNEGSLAPHAIF